MAGQENLSLSDRTCMRANRSVCITIVIVSIFLILMYLGQILQGIMGVKRAVIIALMIAVPMLLSMIYFAVIVELQAFCDNNVLCCIRGFMSFVQGFCV